ncbi:MAG: GtrA family protein [Bacteroidales bacterium]|nr:GtrA family protein [Bacteroidales bacterium]
MKLSQIYRSHRHFFLYAIIGVISTGVEFVVFALLYKLIPYMWANIIGFHCGIISSFLLNRSFNFKKEDRVILRFTTFYLIQLVCLALNSLILYLCVSIGDINPLISKALSIVLTALIPFFLNKSITFSKKLDH